MRHEHRGHGPHGPHGRRRLPAIVWRVHHGLRRSMFRAFGLAILISAALGWGVHAMLEPSKLAVPVALALAAAVLWMAAGGIAWALTRPLIELVSVARAIGEGLLCFDVEDRGPGFADGEHERVFESFVQGRAREGGSLGLGLSLVSRIARAHGGERGPAIGHRGARAWALAWHSTAVPSVAMR